MNIWAAIIHTRSDSFDVRILVSDNEDRRETVSDFALNTGAILAVNGGYFLMHQNPTNHVGLLVTSDSIVEPASETVIRNGKHYPVARGAFGIRNDDTFDIAWASTHHDSIFYWESPIQNRIDQPAPYLDFSLARYWDVTQAIHAGPVLVQNGHQQISTEEEVFFGTSIPEVHPRTAVGYRQNDDLVVVVVDGRQKESRGVSLEELAQIMIELGCVEALNLDGGGSSAMVAAGELLNRPAGSDSEREVMSAIGIYRHE
ncbi:MAG: phosphodiester glycosidase family protein [Fidelibacterota bacterium]